MSLKLNGIGFGIGSVLSQPASSDFFSNDNNPDVDFYEVSQTPTVFLDYGTITGTVDSIVDFGSIS